MIEYWDYGITVTILFIRIMAIVETGIRVRLSVRVKGQVG